MKKLGVVLASALAAGLFFGCSNDSDDNNMGLLLAVANGGSSSITANLPENVGANELAGKSFNNELVLGNQTISETISFDNNTVTSTAIVNYPENKENGTKAYTYTTISTKRYSYNAETKNLYYPYLSSSDKTIYTNDANEKFEQPSMTFSTEKEYSTKMKDFFKNLSKIKGKEYTEEQLNQRITDNLKNIRQQVYNLSLQYDLPTAYTDKNNETPLTPDQISFYNKYITMMEKANKRTIRCHAYKLEGNNLKLYYNSGNLPAGIKFSGIYNGTYNFSADIKKNGLPAGTININALQIIDPDNSLGAKNFTPSISFNGSSFKVTSASDDSVTGLLEGAKITLKLENETTEEKTTVTIKMQEGDYAVTFGTFEIPYNKDLPDYYTTYTKCE
ncbi:MAG: hypothetical protein SOT45_03640 [Treponema sp.]|nr:hypothetical protein [Treponema sp.]